MSIKTEQIRIERLGRKGHGMARLAGAKLLVRGGLPGESYRVSYNSALTDWQEVSSAQRLTQSIYRVKSFCQHHGSGPRDCHGCPWMELDYPMQLEHKLARVRHAFVRIGREAIAEQIQTIHPAPQIQGVRSRCQLKTNGKLLGLVSPNKEIVPIQDCPALVPHTRQLLKEVRNLLPREDWRPDEKHKWCFIDLDDQMQIEDVMINRKRPFFQAMSAQNELMKKWLIERIEQYEISGPCLELFAGSGNFTRSLLEKCPDVHAVEFQSASLSELQKVHPKLRVGCLNLYNKRALVKFWEGISQYEMLLANPPQQGIQNARRWVKETGIRHLFYISCSLESFMKDAQQLLKAGMRPRDIELVDQFPHTPHVEIVSYWSF